MEIVRCVFAEWAVGDFSGGDHFHPDVEFEMVDWPESDSSRGVEAMARQWMDTLAAWEDFRAEPAEVIDTGAHVVVLCHVSGRGRGSGADMSADTGTVWTLEAGRIVRLALYWDSAKALQAVGR